MPVLLAENQAFIIWVADTVCRGGRHNFIFKPAMFGGAPCLPTGPPGINDGLEDIPRPFWNWWLQGTILFRTTRNDIPKRRVQINAVDQSLLISVECLQ